LLEPEIKFGQLVKTLVCNQLTSFDFALKLVEGIEVAEVGLLQQK